MSYTYGFFDAVDLGDGNFDRVYSSAEFSHYWALLVGDGVFGQPSTSLNVLATTPVAMGVKVSPGTGWIKGHYLTVPDNMDEFIAIPVANPSLPRIDSIIMALDNNDRDMKLYFRSGTAAVSPTAVALQRDADVWELELAQITVAAGAGNITQSAIRDMRTDPNRCGIVTGLIDQFDVSGFFTAAQASFNEWFEEVRGQLGEDVAGNLLNLIQGLQDSKLDISSKATEEEALSGTDDTKYMTPATTKAAGENIKKWAWSRFALEPSAVYAYKENLFGSTVADMLVTDEYIIYVHVDSDPYVISFILIDKNYNVHRVLTSLTVYSSVQYVSNLIQDTDGTFWMAYATSSSACTLINFRFTDGLTGITIIRSKSIPVSNASAFVSSRCLRKYSTYVLVGVYPENNQALVYRITSDSSSAVTLSFGASLPGPSYNTRERVSEVDSSGNVYIFRGISGTGGSSSTSTRAFYSVLKFNIVDSSNGELLSFKKSVNNYGGKGFCRVENSKLGDIYFIYSYYWNTTFNDVSSHELVIVRIKDGVATKTTVTIPESNYYEYISAFIDDGDNVVVLVPNKAYVFTPNLVLTETIITNLKSVRGVYPSSFKDGTILNGKSLIDYGTFEIKTIAKNPLSTDSYSYNQPEPSLFWGDYCFVPYAASSDYSYMYSGGSRYKVNAREIAIRGVIEE